MEFVKLVFVIEPDESGWPPVRKEGMWATRAPGDLYVLDNIPFYATAACGDHFRATEIDGELYASELVLESGHGTVRVIGSKEELDAIRRTAIEPGCTCERSESMLAIDVPGTVDWPRLQGELRRAHEAGRIDYEEAVLPSARPGE